MIPLLDRREAGYYVGLSAKKLAASNLNSSHLQLKQLGGLVGY